MLSALKALPLLYRLATVLALVAALGGSLWGAYAYVKHQGYVDGYRVARAECEDEKEKMRTANQNAINDAAKKLREAEAGLTELEIKLEDYTNALDLLADQAPGAGDVCLYAPSVRRLSAIQ